MSVAASATRYVTKFGSLKSFEKGRVENISDDVKNYAFSNCFEIANQSKPYEKVVFGQNQIYVRVDVARSGGGEVLARWNLSRRRTGEWLLCEFHCDPGQIVQGQCGAGRSVRCIRERDHFQE